MELLREFLKEAEVLPLGMRKIASVSAKGRPRYVIYLPTQLNELWEEIRRRGKKVFVVLKVQ